MDTTPNTTPPSHEPAPEQRGSGRGGALKNKRIIIPAIAAVLALGVGGAVWAATASNDKLEGADYDRASSAALEAVGGGKVTSAEKTDRDGDDGAEWYEVEGTREDGSEFDVSLDKDFNVLPDDDVIDNGAAATDPSASPSPSTGDQGTQGDDDRALSADERTKAERAALAAVPGTVIDIDASDDRGVAYEVEVRAKDGREWNLDLDRGFTVVKKQLDD